MLEVGLGANIEREGNRDIPPQVSLKALPQILLLDFEVEGSFGKNQ